MIRLGICTSIDHAPILREIGYDYLELNMTQVAQMSEAAYADLHAAVQSSPLPVEAMNSMIPAEYPLCGPEGTGERVRAYLQTAFSRAQALGVQVVVFGSGGARRLPEGMTQAQGYAHLAAYLALAGRMAQDYGLSIAIEPLRAQECNILHHVAEAQYLASRVGLPNVGALADLYHMMSGGEDCTAVERGILHAHIAERVQRAYPRQGDGSEPEYEAFFRALHAGGYAGRVSIEGNCGDFAADACAAYALLNTYR